MRLICLQLEECQPAQGTSADASQNVDDDRLQVPDIPRRSQLRLPERATADNEASPLRAPCNLDTLSTTDRANAGRRPETEVVDDGDPRRLEHPSTSRRWSCFGCCSTTSRSWTSGGAR